MAERLPRSPRTRWLRILVRIRRSSRENLDDYADFMRFVGLVASVLWVGYGVFCTRILGLRESMGWRWILSVGTFALWTRARSRRFAGVDRFVWVALSTLGMFWLPWHLYFLNDRAPYWQLSIVFFCLAFATSVRSFDFVAALVVGVGALIATHHADIDHREVPLFAVAAITLWLVSSGIQTIRVAQRRIAAQGREIMRQNDRLKALDRDKDLFTANIAHDLRTPLTVALSLADDLSRDVLSSRSRERLASLGDSLRQMRRQSDELLDLQRFLLGVARLDRREVDVASWLSRFEEGFASMAHARGLTFQVVLPDLELRASLDPQRIETAVFNLVSNAFKFTPAGGHVEVHLRRHGATGIGLAVLDDGEGIPPDALQKIFDRFQQVDRGPGTYTAGAGIGLSLVKDVAEAHGGHVSVQSTLGLGSLFEMVLPDVLVASAPRSLELTPAPAPFGLIANVRPPSVGRLAVVAEDQALLRQVIHDVLERVAKVATAKDGREALRLVHELNPDIVVTDYSMPGMNGLEFLAALRADPATRELPVVILTGDPVSLRSRLAEEPTLAILGKPFEHAELLGKVEAMMNRHENAA